MNRHVDRTTMTNDEWLVMACMHAIRHFRKFNDGIQKKSKKDDKETDEQKRLRKYLKNGAVSESSKWLSTLEKYRAEGGLLTLDLFKMKVEHEASSIASGAAKGCGSEDVRALASLIDLRGATFTDIANLETSPTNQVLVCIFVCG